MELQLLDTILHHQEHIGLSRTHGVHHGDKKDMFGLEWAQQEMEFVVSIWMLHTQHFPHERKGWDDKDRWVLSVLHIVLIIWMNNDTHINTLYKKY